MQLLGQRAALDTRRGQRGQQVDVDLQPVCHGDTPGFADCALVPQVANARRFKVDLTAFPTICRIDAACRELEPFIKAAPENQPDAQ